MAYRDFDDDELALRSAESAVPLIDFSNHPVIEVINNLAVALFEILGPFCWAALILLFLFAEFTAD
jgi:hypothetical protein